MANRIVQAVYDIVDNVSGKLKDIGNALRGHASESEAVSSKIERNNKRVSESYGASAEGIGKLKAALIAIGAFVGLEKLKDGLEGIVEAGEKFDDLGKKFATAFGGVDKGAAALQRVRDLAKNVPQSFEEVSAAAIKLRQLGFDPLDGTLQALLDNQNALDQSNEGLIATIDALGKANVRGGVNLKSLVALTESGIPVFDLLGKAMGVSADRVRQLAESGQLGTDSIKLLVTQLGELRAGAALSELGDTNSQLVKLKDTAKQFLEEIASSGALDVFREELKKLNASVEEAAKSGRLKEIAQSISDGIVATAGAIKSAITFVFDYAGALTRLAQVYVTFRAIDITSALLKTSSGLETSARAAKTAAAEAGAATGFFAKLGGVLGGLKTNIVLTVAVLGIEFALEGLAKLVAFRQEQLRLDREIREADAANIAGKAKLGAAIDDIKAKYGQFAGVAIESGELLQKQGVDQLQSYKDQLNGARTFYNALVVAATAAGDAVALKGAQEKLDAVNVEIGKVNAQLQVTQIAGKDAAAGLTAGAAQMIAKLSELGGDAKATGDLIKKAFEGFDLKHSTTAAGELAIAIDTVAAKGGKAAEVLNTTLLESLKKLSGEDLLKFQSGAIAAIDSLGVSGEKTSEVLKDTLEVALDRLGVKSEATGQTITKTGADIIATFQAVAENSQASAKAITAAFEAALISAKTIDEVKALGAALEGAAALGKISLKDLAAAAVDLDERLRTVTASISPLASQFQLLGIKSQAQLNAVRDNAREAFDAVVTGAQKGVAAQEDVTRAFKVYVDAARAASADSTQAAKDTVEEQLAVLASVLNLSDAFTKAGDSGKKAGEETRDAFAQTKDQIDAASAAADALGSKAAAAANSAQTAAAAATKAAAATQAAFAGGVIPVTEQASRALAIMNDELFRTGTLANVSLEDAKFLLNSLGVLAGAQTEVLRKRIEELTQAAQHAEEVAKKMADDAASIQDQIDQLQGNDTAIEDRRHAKKLKDLEDEAKADGSERTDAYRNLIELENKLHTLKMQNIQTQAAAQQHANGNTPAKPSGGVGSGNGSGSSNGAGVPSNQTVHVNTDLSGAVIIGANKQDVEDILGRLVLPGLKRIQSNSVGSIFGGRG